MDIELIKKKQSLAEQAINIADISAYNEIQQKIYQRGNTTLHRLRNIQVTLQRYTMLVACITEWRKLVDNNVPQAWLDYITEHPYVHEG